MREQKSGKAEQGTEKTKHNLQVIITFNVQQLIWVRLMLDGGKDKHTQLSNTDSW